MYSAIARSSAGGAVSGAAGLPVAGVSAAGVSAVRCRVRRTSRTRSQRWLTESRCWEKATSIVLMIRRVTVSRSCSSVAVSAMISPRSPAYCSFSLLKRAWSCWNASIFVCFRDIAARRSRCRSMSTRSVWTASTLCCSAL